MSHIHEHMEVRWCKSSGALTQRKLCCNTIEDYLWVCGDVNASLCTVVNELHKVVTLNRQIYD